MTLKQTIEDFISRFPGCVGVYDAQTWPKTPGSAGIVLDTVGVTVLVQDGNQDQGRDAYADQPWVVSVTWQALYEQGPDAFLSRLGKVLSAAL